MKAELKSRFTEKFAALGSIKDRIALIEEKKDAIADNGRITRANFFTAAEALDKAKLGSISGQVSDKDLKKANDEFVAAKKAHEAQLEEEAFAQRVVIPTDELQDATHEFKMMRARYFHALCADKKVELNSGDARRQLIELFVAEICLMSSNFELAVFGPSAHYQYHWNDMLFRVFAVPSTAEMVGGMRSILKSTAVSAVNPPLNSSPTLKG